MSDESSRWKDQGARIRQSVLMKQVRPWEASSRAREARKTRTFTHERLATALATLTIPIKGKART